MMPLAPSPVAPVPSKPKIGFSIESLVGKDPPGPPGSTTSGSRPNSSSAASRTSSPTQRARSLSPFEGSHHHPHHGNHHGHHQGHHHHHHQQGPPSPSSNDSPGPQGPPTSIHAPTALGPNPFMDTLNSLKGIYAPEPTYGPPGGMLPQGLMHHAGPCGPLGHVPQHPGFPNLSPLFLGNIGTVGHHQLHRDAYPLYPWLLSRQGRFLGHRFQGPDAPAFLLQPFRKPKRIRTAFSPSQLLKLEHAFEKNHYVVGAERKHLAQTLSLTETQVKVWFQNRRTKHKRLKQEEEQSQSSPPSPTKKKAPSTDDEFVQDFDTST